jgi:hypothetical protein
MIQYCKSRLFILAAVFIGLTGKRASASDLVIAPPNSESSGCDLAVAGFSAKEPFLKFFDQLRSAAQKSDKAALSGLILYPLRVNGKKPKVIRNSAEFLKRFDSLFTSDIQSVIEKQRPDKLFCRDQGVMYGGGEIWVRISGDKIGIITLNPL